MCFGSVQIISCLENQSKFQMFTLFSGRHIGGPPTWRLHTRLYNFARNISTNISTLGQRTHLKLGELSSLNIVSNITISSLYLLNGFWFYFLFDNAHTLLPCSGAQCCLTTRNNKRNTIESLPNGYHEPMLKCKGARWKKLCQKKAWKKKVE